MSFVRVTPVLWPSMLASVACVASLGCVVDVDFGNRGFECAEEPVCPTGYQCIEKMCVLDSETPDAATGASDGSTDATPLAPSVGTFSAGMENTEISSATFSDDDESLSADRLTVVFNSSRSGNSEFWTSTREQADDAWPAPTLDAELSTPSSDTTVALSANGLAILFGSNRPGTAGLVDLYIARRLARTDSWGEAVHLIGPNTAANDLASWISDDATELIIHNNVTGDYDIYTTEGNPDTGVYGAPVPIAELNVAGSLDASARFAADGRLITFFSDRPGGAGGYDIYVASRATTELPFENVRQIEGVNTAANDSDPWLSEDLCYLAFARPNGGGVSSIFEATCVSP